MGAAQVLDGDVVRRWLALSAEALGQARASIDGLNVFPVPDADTGTNLYQTVSCAAHAAAELPERAPAARVWQAATSAALVGACGNSGIILSQLLRGLAEGCAGPAPCDGLVLAGALGRAAELARAAVRHPVEGTLLTVADAAARGASALAAAAGDAGQQRGPGSSGAGCLPEVALAAAAAARMALQATTRQLAALAASGVVDAGGAGLCVLLDALSAAVAGELLDPANGPDRLPVFAALAGAPVAAGGAAVAAPAASGAQLAAGAAAGSGVTGAPVPNAYEVTFLLEADEQAVGQLADRLDALGDSLVISGGAAPGLGEQAGPEPGGGRAPGASGRPATGQWHVHVHVANAGAVVEQALAAGQPRRITVSYLAAPAPAMPAGRRAHQAVVIAEGPALCSLLRNAGALVVEAGSLVQSIAAVAVHDPHRDPAADAAAMASAAAGMRTGSIEYCRAWNDGAEAGTTSLAGVVGGQVIAGGGPVADVLRAVLAALLRPDTELVTLVRGAAAEPGLDGRAAELVREFSPRAEVTCYDGGMTNAVLLIGAE